MVTAIEEQYPAGTCRKLSCPKGRIDLLREDALIMTQKLWSKQNFWELLPVQEMLLLHRERFQNLKC